MTRKNLKLRLSLLVLLVGVVAAAPVFAGSAVVGSVAGTLNATVGGQTLLPNTTIFSGDSLQVRDGVTVVAIGQGSRMVFGRDTEASFLRESKDVTVLLSHGNVSMFHPEDTVALRVKVGEVSVVPAAGFKTLGEVAMLNGAVVVSTKEGMLRVEGNGPAVTVAKGQSITLSPRTARAPQAAGGAGAARISSSTGLQIASVAAGATSAVVAGIAVSRAGDAKDAAAAAQATASSAVSAANAANTSAQDAAAAAAAAGDTSNAVGCALNIFANEQDMPSPYTPPAGSSC